MKNFFTLICLFAIYFLTQTTQAQTWQWAKSFGAHGPDGASCIQTDAAGNVYLVAWCSDSLDVDPGPGVLYLIGSPAYNICLIKMDALGNLLWAKLMGGTFNHVIFSGINKMAIDASSNIYITSDFTSTVDFDPGVGVYNLSAAGSSDICITKLDSSGNFIWAKSVGSTNDDRGNSIYIDTNYHLYLTGFFHNTMDVDPGPATNDLISNGNEDIFILKWDSSGGFIWGKSMGSGSSDEQGNGVIADNSGNVFMTGLFRATVDFDPGPGVVNLSSPGVYRMEIFVCKLDISGNLVWARNMGGTEDDYGLAIALSPGGNGVYTTGTYKDTADLNPGPGVYNVYINGSTAPHLFISKLDGSGNFLWGHGLGGAGGAGGGESLAVDGADNVIITGYFSDTVDFDPGSGSYIVSTVPDSSDAFILKFNPGGIFQWVTTIAGPYVERGLSSKLTSNGDLYVSGDFNSDFLYIGSTLLTLNNTSLMNYPDFFIAKLGGITGMDDKEIYASSWVYPNPSDGKLRYRTGMSNTLIDLKLMDLTGKELWYKRIYSSDGIVDMDFTSFVAGIYFIEASAENNIQRKKILISR